MLRSRTVRFCILATVITAGAIAAFVIHRHRLQENTADAVLARADDLSWKNQWIAAAPLYREAEHRFSEENRPSEALYAHVSQFIPRAESEPIPSLLLELQRDQQLPAAQESETKLRILVIQGMIETNYDASMARKTWEQVQSIAQRRGHLLLAARAMGEQGIAAFLLGDFSAAKKLVLRAWFASRYLHDPAAHVRYASVYGAGLVEMQRYDEALRALDEAINTATAAGDVAYPSIAINSKIDAFRGLHQYDKALALSDEAIRRLPPAQLDAHLFQILTSKGEIYEDLERWNDAANQYGLALSYARHLNYWRGIAQTGGLLAQTFEHQGNLEAALSTINQAIDANVRIPEELYYSPRNLAIKAEILEKMGHAKESNALYEKSEDLVDSLVATAPTPTVERQVITEMELVYSGHFESLCRQGNLAAAFQTIEKARGRIEAQSLEHHPLIPPHDPTPQEKRITQLNLELIETDNPGTRPQLAQALYEAELQLDDSSLAGKTARTPMTLKSVQKHLRPTELVLEYVLADPDSCVLAITADSVHKYDLTSRKMIEGLALQYRKAIHNRKADPALAQALYNQLIAPVAEYSGRPEVIVIPDGELHLLPFSALMERGEYVLKSHAFSASPSATVLSLLRDRESTTLDDSRQFVGVAAWTDTTRHENKFLRSVSFSGNKQLQPLPESKEEVETIARDFPLSSTVLLGSNATKTRFKSLPLEQYRFLDLALHGHVDVEFPDRSALVFAPQPGGSDDGLLDVREIRSLHLKANLVTLSACNTGIGPVGEADVADMGNAFIEAGAESVVSTLWELEDRTTAQLMTAFYKNLVGHESKTNALRDAQLDLLRAGLPPYYWASFELVGDPAGTV